VTALGIAYTHTAAVSAGISVDCVHYDYLLYLQFREFAKYGEMGQ